MRRAPLRHRLDRPWLLRCSSLGLLSLGFLLAGPVACSYEPWSFSFDVRSGDEYRVRDMRVVGITVDPPEVLLAPAQRLNGLRAGEAAAPYALDVEVSVLDPRGGVVDVEVQLCPDPAPLGPPFSTRLVAGGLAPVEYDILASCAELDLRGAPDAVRAAWAPRRRSALARATRLTPGGRVDDLRFSFSLSSAALDHLFARWGDPEVTLAGHTLFVAVRASRLYDGTRESEWAYVALALRTDLTHPDMPEALLRAALDPLGARVCDSLDDCRAQAPTFEVCGDGVVEGIEQCDPPDGFACGEDCMLSSPDTCADICLGPMVKNALPVLRGFYAQVYPPGRPPFFESQAPVDEPPPDAPRPPTDEPDPPSGNVPEPVGTFMPLGEPLRLSPGAFALLTADIDPASVEAYQIEDPKGFVDPVPGSVDAGVPIDDDQRPLPGEPGAPTFERVLLPVFEFTQPRWFIPGGGGDLYFTDGTPMQSSTGPRELIYRAPIVAPDTGNQQVWFTVSDGRGGVVTHVLTVELQ